MPRYDDRTIELWDDVWKKLKGANQQPYDVSGPLQQLERERNPDGIARIYDELWKNLVKDGMIGSASLMAIPHLVRIAKQNHIFDANLLRLCATINVLNGDKIYIKIPRGYDDYESFCKRGLTSLREYIAENLKRDDLDEATLRYAAAALATIQQEYWLAHTLLLMDVERQVKYVESTDDRNKWPERMTDECEYMGY